LAEKDERTAVLHIQDACTAVTSNEYCRKFLDRKINLYALRADVKARGLAKKTCLGVKAIDYREWVNLLISEHEKIVSWTS